MVGCLQKNVFVFSWKLIALQFCVDFCHTSAWFSQRYTCMCPLPLEPPSHPVTSSHLWRLSESTGLSSLHHTENSHWLSILHIIMHMFQCYSCNLSHLLLPLLCPRICLYVYVSVAALQIGSLVLFFNIPYICINIQYLFFCFLIYFSL